MGDSPYKSNVTMIRKNRHKSYSQILLDHTRSLENQLIVRKVLEIHNRSLEKTKLLKNSIIYPSI